MNFVGFIEINNNNKCISAAYSQLQQLCRISRVTIFVYIKKKKQDKQFWHNFQTIV